MDGRKLSHERLEQIRMRAVSLVQAGRTAAEVARLTNLNVRRVFEWLATYRTGGWQALRSRKASGRPRRLDTRQLQWVYDAVAENDPRRFELPYPLWTHQQIRILIERQFGVSVSVSSIRQWMMQWGLTAPLPRLRTSESNHPSGAHWPRCEYLRIRSWAKRSGAQVLFLGGSTLMSKPNAASLPQGSGASLATPTLRRLVTAASARGTLRFMVMPVDTRSDILVEFLERLMYEQSRPIYLIVDTDPSHYSAAVQSYVDSLQDKLRLFVLPSYRSDSPSHAPAANEQRKARSSLGLEDRSRPLE